MTRLGWLLLRVYLGLFAFLACDRAHARREHALIEFSLREAYTTHRSRGFGRGRAAFSAILDHLAELSPLALYGKTRADAAYAPGGGEHAGHRWPEVAVLAIGGLLALATVNSIERSSNPPYWAPVALLPAVAGTALMLAVVVALQRRAPVGLVVFVAALGLWPLWQRMLPMTDGSAAATVSVAALLVIVTTLRRPSSMWGAALLTLAPLVTAVSRSLRPSLIGPGDGFGGSHGEVVALIGIATLTVYVLLLAVALRLLSRRSAEHPTSEVAN